MTPKMLLKVLTTRSKPGSGGHQRQPSGDEGFAFAATILVVLSIILGTVALANRSNLGSLGSFYQTQSRDARAAAEIGMANIVSELNRPRNRQLLVNAVLLDTQTRSTLQNGTTYLRLNVPSGLSPSVSLLSATFANDNLKAEQTINATQRFQLINVCNGTDCSSPNETLSASKLASPYQLNSPTTAGGTFGVTIGNKNTPAAPGAITLQVRGFAYRGNTVVASASLTRTYEVVPKCLDRSLRGVNASTGVTTVFGNDGRACPAPPSFGFVAGAAENNTGDLKVFGSADILSSSGTALPQVTCIASLASGCNIVDMPAGTTVNVVPFDLPNPLTMPATPAPATSCVTNAANTIGRSGDCNITISSGAVTLSSNTGTDVPSPNGIDYWPWATTGGGPTGNNFGNVCTRNTTPTPPEVNCSINRISAGNNSALILDSAGGPIRFFFPNRDEGTTKTVDFGNNSGFQQINSLNSGTPIKLTDFSIFGCLGLTTPCGNQNIKLGNGQGADLLMYLYFPNGIIEFNGGTQFTGVIWTNDFRSGGSTEITVPESGVADVIALMGLTGSIADPNATPFVDYVTRAIRFSRFF